MQLYWTALSSATLPPNIKEFDKNIELADSFLNISSEIDILSSAILFAEVFDGGWKPFKCLTIQLLIEQILVGF